jgi:uncharacterized protein YgbK (DUF1537 family)
MPTSHPAHPPVFGAIADDLTGGAELASMLVSRGIRTSFGIGAIAAQEGDFDAHVVALKTRVVPADHAVRKVVDVARALRARGARQLFFKYCATFDSTPAGNVGPCAEALMDLLDARQALFVPALCETRRTVYQGHMFGGTQLLAESPKRFDPLTPMTDSNLVRVLQAQSRQTVGLVDHAAVDAGPDAIEASCARQLAQDGASLLIADTLYERDLAALARAAVDMPLLTGNSSVAAHLPPLWLERGLVAEPATIRLPAAEGPGAVLVGSVAAQTIAQLEHFETTGARVLTVDLAAAFAGADVVGQARTFAAAAIADGRSFAISTAVPQADVERLQSTYGRDAAAEKAEAILSELARIVVLDLGVRRLIVAGGETSGAVMAALGIAELDIGPYQGPGFSRAFARTPVPLALMLKSGKLGPVDVFSLVLDDMRRPIEREPMLDHWPPPKL